MIYLFDIDGTILLTGGAGTLAINRVFRERYGVENAMAGVRAGGKTDPMILNECFAATLDRLADDDEIQEVLDIYVPYLEEEVARATKFRIMPGAIEAVRFLQKQPGVRLGIATGNVEAAARIKLERAGVWDAFEFGGYGCDSADRATLVETAIHRAEAPRDRIAVVGDTPHDVSAARACGVRVIAVPTGSFSRDELADTEPDALLDTLWELPEHHRQQHGS